ncbi:MAG: phage tail tape measure protein [Trueperella sp.]|uniref:phage tail tape measure protein n=1 Tax=Trueperella sp. TaxID=2699835 RepID=UPI0025F9A2EB|nr:phage tail tape measure protein [Trueperella sp.]MCI7306150.1 phage tail tape measure protein [Trueperella sp.]
MRERSVKVVLRANVEDFRKNMAAASTSFEQAVRDMDKSAQVASTNGGRLVQSMQAQRAEWDRIGGVLVAFGAGLTAAFAGSAKAAIDWESSFAGVRKTVDASEAEFALLDTRLRDMARSMPATHAEIAQVAEAAGQLGIETRNLDSFTEAMIQMGEATNLSADEAATQLARFANIMGTSQTAFTNMGSAIVALGNNFATTESEIVNMSMRLASAGKQAGMTEGDIFGIATALSSVGIEAEAGGTAVSKVIIEMRNAVDTGSGKLEVFAKVAGMTGEQFARAFRDDAAGALTMFIQGLAQMEATGQSTYPVLQELGMTDVRVGNVLRSSANAADLFTGAIEMGNSAYQENTALSDEYAARMETTAAKLDVFKNNVVDLAISLGDLLLPALSFVVEGLTGVVHWIGDLPAPLQVVIGVFTGLGGVISLAAGGFMLLAPRVLDAYHAFQALKSANILGIGTAMGEAGGMARGLVGAIAGLSGPIALVAGSVGVLAGVVASYVNEGRAAEEVSRRLAGSFDRVTGAATGNTRELLAAELAANGVAEDYAALGGNVADLIPAIEGNADAIARVNEILGVNSDQIEDAYNGAELLGLNMAAADQAAYGLGNTLGDMAVEPVSEGMNDLRNRLHDVAAGFDLAGSDANYAAQMLEGAEAAMDGTAGASDDLAGSSEVAAGGISQVGEEAAGAQQALDDYIASLFEAAGINMSVDEAAIRYADTLTKVTENLHAAAGASATGTKEQRENQASLIDLARDSARWMQAMIKQGGVTDDLAARTQQMTGDFLATARQMGVNSDRAVELAADYGLIPADIRTEAEFDDWQARYKVDGWKLWMDSIPARKEVTLVQKIVQQGALIGAGVGMSTPGYSQGGYTGPGRVTEPAGIVHKGEVVWSQRDVARAGGVAVVEAMRRGLRGYQAGGVVQGPSAQAPRPVVNVATPSLEGMRIEGALQVGEALVPLIDGRIVRREKQRALVRR